MGEHKETEMNEKVLAHLHNFYHENPYVQLLEIQVTKTGSNTNVQVIDQSGDKNLAFKMFDTTVPTTI